MTVSQISVFTQSKPGHMLRILKVFEDSSINVRGYAVSDTGDYGIARFIVDRPDEACKALESANCAYTVTQVICLKLADRPGELARIFGILASHGINVSYSYSMISTYIIINAADIESARAAIEDEQVEIVSQDMLESLTA